MDLFNTQTTPNLLPYDGVVNYYGQVLDAIQAQHYLERLLETIEWKNDEVMIFGKHIITKRKVAWYANDTYFYTYSKIAKQALLWTNELLELKNIVETISQTTFNSCLLNLYHNGNEGMGWHSDDEESIVVNSAIASLSLGAGRKFLLKHKESKQGVSVMLEKGSLLVMQGSTQTHWLHSLPKSLKIAEPRINLTFRTMIL